MMIVPAKLEGRDGKALGSRQVLSGRSSNSEVLARSSAKTAADHRNASEHFKTLEGRWRGLAKVAEVSTAMSGAKGEVVDSLLSGAIALGADAIADNYKDQREQEERAAERKEREEAEAIQRQREEERASHNRGGANDRGDIGRHSETRHGVDNVGLDRFGTIC